ncbi:hypothetical protein ACWC0C_19725 [Streptomyces sp. NPDC001709]
MDDQDDTQGFLDAVASAQRVAIASSTIRLPEAARYALYTGSVRSLSEAMPATLLVRAVACRVLEARQALTYARQIPWPARRAATLALLQPELPAEYGKEATREAVEATRAAVDPTQAAATTRAANAAGYYTPGNAFPDPRSPLVQVANALAVDHLADVVAAAHEIDDEEVASAVIAAATARRPDLLPDALQWARAQRNPAMGALTLTRLIPLLSETDRGTVVQEALSRAQNYPRALDEGQVPISDGDDGYMAYVEALEQLAEHLFPEQLDIATAAANALRTAAHRVRVLTALARSCPEAERAALVDQALAILADTPRPLERDQIVGPLARLLPARWARKAFRQGWWWAGGEGTANRLEESARYAGGKLVAPYLAASRRIRSPKHRAPVLAAIVPIVEAADRPRVAAQAWLSLRRWIPQSQDDTRSWRQCIEQIAPHLNPADVQEALSAAARIGDADLRARAVVLLCRYTPGDPDALASIARIDSEPERAEQLADLVPGLPPAQLARAFALAAQIDPFWRATPLAALARRAPTEDRPAVLRNTLKVMTKNNRHDIKPLLAIADMLEGPILDQAVEKLFMGYAWDSVRTAVFALAPRLTAEHWRRILSSRYLGAVADGVPANMVADTLAVALDRVDDRNGGVEALCVLAPRANPDQVQRILQAADTCRFADDRAALFAAVAPYLADDLAVDAVRKVITYVLEEQPSDEVRAKRLRQLGEGWGRRPCPIAVQRLLLNAVFKISTSSHRADAIRGISGCLSPGQLRECLSRAREGGSPRNDMIAMVPALPGDERDRVVEELMADSPSRSELHHLAVLT